MKMKIKGGAFDFILSDLVITEIKNVYWAEVGNWSRPVPVPRNANGLVLVTGGRIDYVFGGESFSGSKGDVLFFPKGVPYSGTKRGDSPNSYYVIDFDTFKDDECVLFPLPFAFRVSNYDMLESAFRSVLNQWVNKSPASRIKCREKIYRLISLVVEDYLKGSAQFKELGIFPQVAEYMSRNFTDPQLNIKRICREFYISEPHLRRIFHKAINQPPIKYLQTLRLELAKSMLCEGNASISVEEVAYSCGFSSLQYFSRLFKKYTGVPPSRYGGVRDGA